MGEARGGTEDRLLKKSYARVYQSGVWTTQAHAFQAALTSCELKLKAKVANISGLQLADLLGHPVKQWVLRRHGLIPDEPPPFACRLMEAVTPKLNRQPNTGEIENYGTVLYPKK